MKKSVQQIAFVALLTFSGYWIFADHNPGASASMRHVEFGSSSSIAGPDQTSHQPGPSSPAKRTVPSPRKSAPPSLSAAYPALTELPSDWHAFNRTTEKITVAPYPDLPLTFQRTAVKDEGKYVTWFGTVKEIPGSSLVAVATPGGGQTSILVMPGSSQFSFYTAPAPSDK
jgi:hypothetical protein